MQLSGELSKVNLPNLLQLVKTGGLTGKIAFSQGAKAATVMVADGLPVHAEVEGEDGLDGFMELFLWTSGSFSFNEESLQGLQATILKDDPDMSFERLLKEGLAYSVEKRYLDELKITPSSVLTPTGTAVSFAKQVLAMPGLERLDGKKTLAEALGDLQLSKRDYVRTVSSWIADGLADIVEPGMGAEVDPVELPNWVISRLKQDNPNISQAIVDMVIWVDRVKCWMFQVDADLYRVRKVLELNDSHNAAGAQVPPGSLNPFAVYPSTNPESLHSEDDNPAGGQPQDIFGEPSAPPLSSPFLPRGNFSNVLGQGGPVRYGDPSYWRGSNFYTSGGQNPASDIADDTTYRDPYFSPFEPFLSPSDDTPAVNETGKQSTDKGQAKTSPAKKEKPGSDKKPGSIEF